MLATMIKELLVAMIKKIILLLLSVTMHVKAETYNFVSINFLAEQQIGAIVLPQIYRKLGIEITIKQLPGNRAQFEAISGISDGEIMRIYTYGNENPTVHRVPTSYYYLETMAFTKKGSSITISNRADLAKYSIAKVRGVKHTNNITTGLANVSNVSSTEAMMRLLNDNLVDVVLTNTIDGLLTIKRLKLENIIISNKPLARLDLFHYIHEDHKALIPRVDKEIQKMKASGELSEIIKKAKKQIMNTTAT